MVTVDGVVPEAVRGSGEPMSDGEAVVVGVVSEASVVSYRVNLEGVISSRVGGGDMRPVETRRWAAALRESEVPGRGGVGSISRTTALNRVIVREYRSFSKVASIVDKFSSTRSRIALRFVAEDGFDPRTRRKV
jgi:hypothetical protein